MNIEPFGYFRALPFGWEDCSDVDEGAMPLYDQYTIDALISEIDDLLERIECLEEDLSGEGY